MNKAIKAKKSYLDCIAASPEEKAELTRYMAKVGGGKILEIGAGAGTAIAEIVHKVEQAFSPDQRPEIIVFDVIADVFDRVKETLGATDVTIKYVVGDGTRNLPFEDGSISAINLSAVAHECFSYGGGYTGLHRLAKECGRVMTPNGILTYRDPDGIELHSMEEACFTTPFARKFLAFFLPKFIDRTHSTLSNKVDLGYAHTLTIHMNGSPLSLNELMNVDSEVLQTAQITINCKGGLIHEIQRHLILFAKDLISIDMQGWGKEGASIDKLDGTRIVEVHHPDAINKVAELLRLSGVNFSHDGGKFALSISALNLLQTQMRVILAHNGDELTVSEDTSCILDWGTSEGEENYFYGSCEEVIARFAHFSIVQDGTGEMGYSCLCPISTDHIRTIERGSHSEFLRDNIKRDTESALKDKKRHIHFTKIPLEKAFPILLNYYRETRHPAVLETLQAFMFILREFSGLQADLPELSQEPSNEVQRCVDLCSRLVAREEVHHGVQAVRSLISAPHLGLVGGIASGKSTIGNILIAHGYQVVSLSDFIRDELLACGTKEPTRKDYFEMANEMRRTRSRDILARLAVQKVVAEGIDRFVFDGMRNPEEVDFLRRFVKDFVLIGVETATEERIRRVQIRLRAIDSAEREKILGDIDREFFDPSPDGCRLSQVMSLANLYVNCNLPLDENKAYIENLKIPAFSN